MRANLIKNFALRKNAFILVWLTANEDVRTRVMISNSYESVN